MKRGRGIQWLVICLFCLVSFLPVKAASELKAPAVKKVTGTAPDTIQAEWKTVPGAEGYLVQVSGQKSFKAKKAVMAEKGSCKVSGLSAGTKYYIRVCSYRNTAAGTEYSSWSSLKTVITGPALSAVVSKKAGAVTVSYGKVKGAAQYEIQIARNKSFTSGKKTIKTAGRSKTVSGLLPEVYYHVRVRSVQKVGKKTVYSAWSKIASVVTKEKKGTYQKKPSAPSGLSVKQNKSGITVQWTSVEDAVRYEVMSASDSGFKKNVKTASVYAYNKPKVTYAENMKTGERFYYKVRVYAEDEYGDRNWSKWSSPKSITVKAKYSYKLYLLNQYPIYGYDAAIVYIKTDNPDAAAFTVEQEGVAVRYGNDFRDIVYTGDTVKDSDWYAHPVKGGYVINFTSGSSEARRMTIEIAEKLGEDYVISTGAGLTIQTRDSSKGYEDWIDSLISQHTDSSMTFWEKMDAVEEYLFNNFHYPSNADGRYLSLVAETGSCWDTMLLDSASSPAALSAVAEKLGCTDTSSVGGYNHATLKVTWKGETRYFMACPYPEEFDQSRVSYIKLP